MNKATKVKNKPNKKNTKKKIEKKSTGIFDFESEVTSKEPKKRKTRKVTHKKTKNKDKTSEKIDKEENYINKKNREKIKLLKKRKNKEKAKREKEISKIKKIQIKEEKQKKSLKQIKQMKKVKKAVKYTFIVFIIFGALILFILSPIFNIKEINILKNEKITKESIMGILNIKPDTNIFKESNKIVKEKLGENPYIDTEKTTIRRLLPSTIVITIAEREVKYLLEFGSVYAYIDEEGNILEISGQTIDGKKIVREFETSPEKIKPGNKLDDTDIAKIKDINKILKVAKNFGIEDAITSINIKDHDNFILYMESEKKTVHIGNTESLDNKMLYVKAIMEKEKENDGEIFVNVDLNNKNAYFKQNV